MRAGNLLASHEITSTDAVLIADIRTRADMVRAGFIAVAWQGGDLALGVLMGWTFLARRGVCTQRVFAVEAGL